MPERASMRRYKGDTMKIAVPSENANGLASMRSGHFGHAPFLTIVELDDDMNVVSVESIKNAEHGEGGCGNVIEFVLGLGLDGILAAGMGMPPLMRFTQGGVAVYVDRSVPTAGEVLALFKDGKVPRMSPDDACRH
jgi:predicted Fe-Mo cluster-binding NifX family protein